MFVKVSLSECRKNIHSILKRVVTYQECYIIMQYSQEKGILVSKEELQSRLYDVFILSDEKVMRFTKKDDETEISKIGVVQFRKQLPSLLRTVGERYNRYMVTFHKQEIAVLLAKEEFMGILNTIEVLRDLDERESVLIAKEEYIRAWPTTRKNEIKILITSSAFNDLRLLEKKEAKIVKYINLAIDDLYENPEKGEPLYGPLNIYRVLKSGYLRLNSSDNNYRIIYSWKENEIVIRNIRALVNLDRAFRV
jgi:PHD/YefM family antitoxin component YafN of YafNO toxin-antitoxin module/mRNA-degrading endonuclease RelE of RelBE toxin-antitoxin system